MTEPRKDPACGNADCSEVIADLYVYLDHECDGHRKEVLQRHLDECSPCLERLGIERQLKELLHRKCGGDQAPHQLRERLKASIRQTVVAQGFDTVRITEVEVEEVRKSDSG